MILNRLPSTVFFIAALPIVFSSTGISNTLGFRDEVLEKTIESLQNNMMTDGHSFEDLKELTLKIGPRLTGSDNANRAVVWGKEKLSGYGLDRVWTQPVTVPHWVRGTHERAEIIASSGNVALAVTALGYSAGTRGLNAPVIEVRSLDDVTKLGKKIKGKIVFFNRPMDPYAEDPFGAYGQAADQRAAGPALAAKFGAAAVLVRSLTTLVDDDHPHTGMTFFPSDTKPIPAAAVSTHAANILSKALREQPDLTVNLELSATRLPDVVSYNVIGEIRGRERPNEIVLVGGHLDSWDLAQGAHDDGAGVVQTLDVCRAINELDLKPRRTVRCVLFMAEEVGAFGAQTYADEEAQSNHRHIMALESDRGGYAPEKFSVDGSGQDLDMLNRGLNLFSKTGVTSFYRGSSGTDVDPLGALGALTMELVPEGKHYFDLHHSALDRIDQVNGAALKNGAAAMATMIYLFADGYYK